MCDGDSRHDSNENQIIIVMTSSSDASLSTIRSTLTSCSLISSHSEGFTPCYHPIHDSSISNSFRSLLSSLIPFCDENTSMTKKSGNKSKSEYSSITSC